MAVPRKRPERRRRNHRSGASSAAVARRTPWKRFALALVVLSALAFGALFAFFFSTGCWGPGRPFLLAADDFFFTLRTFALEDAGRRPEPFSEARYEEVISHLDDDADSVVRGAARWHLERWGEAVVPQLLAELYAGRHRSRRLAAIELLGRLGVRDAIPQLVEQLNATTSSFEKGKILDALDAFGEPVALSALIEHAEGFDRSERGYRRALASIARTGAGLDYLLDLVASSSEPLPEVFEPLVLTGDAHGIEVVASYLDHPEYWIRRGAAAELYTSPAAAPLLLEALASERDDFQRELLIDPGLSSGVMAAERTVADRLGELTRDPIIGTTVVNVLAAHDTPWALAALWSIQTWREPWAIVDRLDPAVKYGPSLLEALLRHEDRHVRTRAVIALGDIHEPASDTLLRRVASRDPDERVRRAARRELLTLDKFRLHRSMRRYKGLSETRWSGWSPPLGDAPGIVRTLHFVACAFSLLLAVALVLGWVKPLEPDRFRFFVTLFLVEGFLGDFILFDDSETLFSLTAGVHTLLLTGLLVQDRAFVMRRVERLAGASLWVFIPCVLYWGSPVIAAALRAAAGEFSFFLALWVLLAANVVFALPVLAPWLHTPPWLRRGLVTGALSAFLVLLGIGLTYYAGVARSRQQATDAVVAVLLLVPLAFKLVGLLSDARVDRKGSPPELPTGSPGRLRLLDLGPTTTLRLPRPRLWGAVGLVLLGCALLGRSGYAVGYNNLGRWGTGELVFTLAWGVVGALLVSVAWCALLRRHVVQIRAGLVRHGVALFGAVVARVAWRRSPPGDLGLDADETSFVRALIAGSADRESTRNPGAGVLA